MVHTERSDKKKHLCILRRVTYSYYAPCIPEMVVSAGARLRSLVSAAASIGIRGGTGPVGPPDRISTTVGPDRPNSDVYATDRTDRTSVSPRWTDRTEKLRLAGPTGPNKNLDSGIFIKVYKTLPGPN